MNVSPHEGTVRVGRRAIAVATVLTLVVVAVAVTPQLLGSRVGQALDSVGQADPGWLWLGGLGFLASLVGSAGAWWSALRLCGSRLSLADTNARYGVGSLVNTFVPARVGDAVRIALFSRAFDHRDRLWTTGGAFAAVGAARAIVLAVLVVCGAAVGALPLWPLLVLGVMVGAAVSVAWLSRGRRARTHVAHALDAFRALGRNPRSGCSIVAWIALAAIGRLGSAAAISAALGLPAPLTAAIIIVPALELAGLMPLTPGNFGVTSGAIAMALQAHGIGMTEALSIGIAYHAVETGVSLLFGVSGLLYVAGGSLKGTRRWAMIGVATTVSFAVVGAFGATVLAPLV